MSGDPDCLARSDPEWEHLVPHYALTAGLLPGQNAPWSELVYFAGTFDGYIVRHNVQALSDFEEEVRRRFLSDGMLPDGLTLLRTALFAEQRRDHFTDWSQGDDPSTMRFVHALVERMRGIVTSGAHVAPPAWTPGGIRDRVMNAFDRLLVGYASWGGHRFHGWTNYADERNFLGPVVWSERDCGLRFALELEREWPGATHMEFAIGKATRADFDKRIEKAQRVDIAVSDLAAFVEDADSQERFRTHRHEAFFEVKWLLKGWRGEAFEMDARKRVAAIPADLAKLAHHLELGRCEVAGMLVVDDESYFDEQSEADAWPSEVWRLVAGPSALRRRGLLSTTKP
jgi:hypothetical protein